MRAQASSTLAAAGVRVQAGSKIRRLMIDLGHGALEDGEVLEHVRATCESSEVENTVRQMMSAVRWLMARSREKGSPRSAALQLR
jgi:hypothetical protein